MMVNVFKDKFVMWGLGNRGKMLYQLLAKENIVAVIDSNPEYKDIWNGVSVINLDIYLENYKEYPIVITPLKCEEIERMLLVNNIQHFCSLDAALVPDMLHEYLDGENITYGELLRKVKEAAHPYITTDDEFTYAAISIFCDNQVRHGTFFNDMDTETDVILIDGINIFVSKYADSFQNGGKFPVFCEDGFIYSIVPPTIEDIPIKYRRGHSFVLDYHGIYYNATSSSCVERMLNSRVELSHSEVIRARSMIDMIIKNKISKYNHQPVCSIETCKEKKNVLVIDQTFGDKSIRFGMANDDSTFTDMLNAAIIENPDADIWVKTHPASSKGHYHYLCQCKPNNVHIIDYPVNTISILELVDIVYVCTSQMGFEAALCGKEVHVFGMPFYAGWGVTKDRQHCPRRTRKRSIEEIFYMAYIVYTKYVSFENNQICEIEQAVNELIQLRNEFFQCGLV